MNRSLVVTAVALGWAACDGRPADQGAAPTREEVRQVDVVRVAPQPLETTARLPGELSPYQAVAIYPRVSGFVESIAVDRGSAVTQGQVLVKLSAPELASQRTEAESKLVGDESTLRRLKAAAGTPGAVAQHDLEVAEAAMAANGARVKALRSMEGYLVVRAPFDGVVTERNVHPGALVGPPAGAGGSPMLRLEDARRLRLTVAVPEAEVGAIAEGASATFTVRAWPGERFTGVIRRLAHTIDSRSRTMAVELDVANDARRLASGMYAEVLWPVRRPGLSLLLPARAVLQGPDRSFVARVRQGVVEQVPVQRGIVVDDRVEVFGDLHAGDLVVATGGDGLKAGTRVQAR